LQNQTQEIKKTTSCSGDTNIAKKSHAKKDLEFRGDTKTWGKNLFFF